MTFFLKPLMLKLSRFWKEYPEFCLPLLFFGLMFIHGSLLWLTDDEAYYWVLAQKPSLGYAFHPPAVAWLIALSEKIFSRQSPGLVRLPGILCMTLTFGLGLRWLKHLQVPKEKMLIAGVSLISFAGLFSFSWMMVPDLPLFLGWTLVFTSVWELCFSKKISAFTSYGIMLGTALALLSKYSAVLAVGSAALSLLFWAPSERRWKGWMALILGVCIGVFPTLFWNAIHDWSSILWQIRDRHQEGHSFSLVRYCRYILIQLVAAGPVLLFFSLWLIGHGLRGFINLRRVKGNPTSFYVLVWLLPSAIIFCLQPLMADFKPHWSFIVWWPAALLMARELSMSSSRFLQRLGKFHQIYGGILSILILLSCHFPWVSMAISDSKGDPRFDVSNDLYGWEELPGWIRSLSDGDALLKLPVIGSRYQTASQAAFALKNLAKVTMIPTDLKSKDEWPDLRVTEGREKRGARLSSSVLFVADNRYDTPPEFSQASCRSIGHFEKKRWRYPAKQIQIWKCDPNRP